MMHRSTSCPCMIRSRCRQPCAVRISRSPSGLGGIPDVSRQGYRDAIFAAQRALA
ncbi:hypothetical protein PVAG01_06312 [Phlyctema vagabunda]|uniref:Uncharacterized protein n=1 Tax=Phlyctema vagabunda TaxID=108571 RepID=A0ABR4PFP4_9HELO